MLLMGGEREFAAGNKNSEVNLISHVIATIPFLWMWGVAGKTGAFGERERG